MKHCPNMESCGMYSLFRMTGTLNIWKTNYCTDRFTECSRYKLSKTATVVPDNLLPNGVRLEVVKG